MIHISPTLSPLLFFKALFSSSENHLPNITQFSYARGALIGAINSIIVHYNLKNNPTVWVPTFICDTVIYLDYSTLKCFWRVIIRIFKYNGRVRSDMAPGCKEQFDLEFLYFVLTFNSKNRKETLKRLDLAKENKRVYIFKSDKEADLFLLKNRNG